MRVLVIMHVESEGVGTLERPLRQAGAQVETARLYAGARLPDRADDYLAVVSMGGPMNVYEEEKYPFLKEETAFLAQAVARNLPVLGVCLGSQLIAKACGARVFKSPAAEVGFSEVSLTEAGWRDPLFRGLPEALPVFQWHEDTFDLPEGATLLAEAPACRHQAFRYRNAYGLQFHLELNGDMLAAWFRHHPERSAILARWAKEEFKIGRAAEIVFANFIALARKNLVAAA